jgi:hypothetical protein
MQCIGRLILRIRSRCMDPIMANFLVVESPQAPSSSFLADCLNSSRRLQVISVFLICLNALYWMGLLRN